MPAAARSNLRNTTAFPPFSDAPEELELVHAGRHWCVLSEIESLDFIARLVLHVRDQDGRELPIAFYTHDNGAMVHDICRPGYTVAVLYGQQRNFLDGSVGIRVEDPARVKIIPYSLATLLAANDLIFEDDPKAHGCASCGETPPVGLSRCSRCEQVYYCDRVGYSRPYARVNELIMLVPPLQECQKTAWIGGHKAVCGAVAALAWFVEQDWERPRGELRF